MIRVDCRLKAISVLLLVLSASPLRLIAQTSSYDQFSSEFQLARAINDKWAAEGYFGSTFSNTPSESRIFKTNIQRYFMGWIHYYYSPRWKISSSLAYFHNKDVPDIGQYESPEWRLSLQGTYFIHKIGYTLSTRMRGELRYIMNANGIYEDKYRYRQQLKYLKPINSKFLRQGVFYAQVNDEIFIKPKARSKGLTFFDRNRFEIGGGYLITDDLQIELTYVNEFLPRDVVNELYHVLSLTISFNNPLENLRKRFSSEPEETNEDN